MRTEQFMTAFTAWKANPTEENREKALRLMYESWGYKYIAGTHT